MTISFGPTEPFFGQDCWRRGSFSSNDFLSKPHSLFSRRSRFLDVPPQFLLISVVVISPPKFFPIPPIFSSCLSLKIAYGRLLRPPSPRAAAPPLFLSPALLSCKAALFLKKLASPPIPVLRFSWPSQGANRSSLSPQSRSRKDTPGKCSFPPAPFFRKPPPL